MVIVIVTQQGEDVGEQRISRRKGKVVEEEEAPPKAAAAEEAAALLMVRRLRDREGEMKLEESKRPMNEEMNHETDPETL